MLSVVLYGRNDSHGYNLHKRAAISLNAIAELLTDADDEILFVDYNTPDDLPTFPEAIADTLTDKAVARLRVLRVRPEIHRTRFAARTHLVALEPIARNVAIRRSNPANKWVLSTNTDMIFCPRSEGQSLTAVVGALEDGFYHLPRFELPEGLWESLDRKDAPKLIASAREWGQRFHLNEITYSSGDNVYDGPGDFQLFLRQDLYEIGGFHEDMIRGWHLDANVARRMRLLRGKVSSALDHLVGYHCDHTRMASAYHKADRLENDPIRFVDHVTAPRIAEQTDSWGLPDVEIEEFRLGEASGARYLNGLNSVIRKPLEGFLETAYVPEAYGRLTYAPDHVLPYLLDLVACAPRNAVLGYVGARRDLFEGLARGWTAMGGAAPVAVPDLAPWLADAGDASVRSLTLDAWVDQADLFIFEIGAEAAKTQIALSPEESARLWAVNCAFNLAAAADFARQRSGAPARRAFIVNGIHNFFEPQVFRAVSSTLTPFSTRIRHGYFADRSPGRLAAATARQKEIAARLGALEPLPARDVARLRALFDALNPSHQEDPPWALASRMGAELAALDAFDPDILGPIDRRQEMMARLAETRPSRQAAVQAAISATAGRGAPNRLTRLEDWDDPAWVALAGELYPTVQHADLFSRERWMWERVTLTQNMAAQLPPHSAPSVLMIGREPEAHAFALAQMGYDVDIIDPVSLAEGRLDAADWRDRYVHDGWVARRPLGLASDRAAAIAQGFRYDAVLAPQNAIFILGRARAGDILRGATALLRPGGHLGFTALVQPMEQDDRPLDHALPPRLVLAGALARAIDHHTELALQGRVDDRLTPRTFDRIGEEDADCPAPILVKGTAPYVETSAAFAFRKREDAKSDWAQIDRLLADPAAAAAPAPERAAPAGFLFSDIEDLEPSAGGPGRFGRLMEAAVIAKDGVKRTPQGLSLRGVEPFMAFHLDLGRLDPGGYEIVVELFQSGSASPQGVIALGVVGGGELIVEHIEPGKPGPRAVNVYFELDSQTAVHGLRLAVKALGGDVDILDMKLR
jgi:hypothetical protein